MPGPSGSTAISATTDSGLARTDESAMQAAMPTGEARSAFHLLAKPVGPICNLDCTYCFYLEKEKLYGRREDWRMDDATLERYVRDYIAAQPGDEASFAFQGGEPTLLGVSYFEKIVALQRKHAGGKRIENSIQTNGTLLDDRWGEFLAGNGFLVGLSLDGPPELHDTWRVDRRQQPTFDKVMAGATVLKRHGVEFNLLACVNSTTVREPERVYDFLRSVGTPFLQFIPIVEREADPVSTKLGLDLGGPPDLRTPPLSRKAPAMTPWSVDPADYGEFLVRVFERWIAADVGEVFVQIIESAAARWLGLPAGICVFEETCGRALALEHNGDVYTCDHFVYPDQKIGNLNTTPLAALADSPMARAFGNAKRDALPRYCRECEVRFACNGECPKHRFTWTPDGEWGLNYLCPAYKRFFNHIAPAMERISWLVRNRQPLDSLGGWWRDRGNDPLTPPGPAS